MGKGGEVTRCELGDGRGGPFIGADKGMAGIFIQGGVLSLYRIQAIILLARPPCRRRSACLTSLLSLSD